MTGGSRPAAATTEHRASDNAGSLSCETRMDMTEKISDTAEALLLNYMHAIKLYFTAYCLTECLFLHFFSPSCLLLWTAHFLQRFSQSAPATVQRLKPVIISSFCLMRKVANNKPWNPQWQRSITRTEMLRAKYCSSWSPNCYLPSRLMKKKIEFYFCLNGTVCVCKVI